MSEITSKETKSTVLDSAKVLIYTCVLAGSDRLDFEVSGMHHPVRGGVGDWIITCKRATWLSRLLFKLRN